MRPCPEHDKDSPGQSSGLPIRAEKGRCDKRNAKHGENV